MNQQARRDLAQKYLREIIENQGTAYALGLMMGILSRLSDNDYDLYRELEIRAELSRSNNNKAPL